MLRILRRVALVVLVLVGIVLAVPALGLSYGWLTTQSLTPDRLAGLAPVTRDEQTALRLRSEIEGYARPEESTFLTYPEWSIVYAARDYAGYVERYRESGFPFWAYVGQFWQDYATVIRATSDYPFNMENHLMLVVIGTSHTIEHAIQSVYENTIGRLTELTAWGLTTPQDRYQASVAAEYAAFLDQVPWYEFPYAEKRSGLWETTPVSGWPRIRSWERKLAFGLSYSIKQIYAGLIRGGLDATSDPALLDINVWAEGPVAQAIEGEPDTNIVEDFGTEGAVFVTQRYQAFTDMVPRLIERGVRFVEIGGNGTILVTVLSHDELDAPPGSRQLFAYPLAAEPSLMRTGLVASVNRLHEVLPDLFAQQARLEHVYDY